VPIVLIIWVYHVLIGGADPRWAAFWTAFFLLIVLVAVPVGLYSERRRPNLTRAQLFAVGYLVFLPLSVGFVAIYVRGRADAIVFSVLGGAGAAALIIGLEIWRNGWSRRS